MASQLCVSFTEWSPSLDKITVERSTILTKQTLFILGLPKEL